MRTVLFLDGSIKVRSFFDSRFVDYFSMSVPMHYPGFLSLLSISYPSTLFSSTVWKQSGEGRFRGKAVPTYVYPEYIKAAIRALVLEDLRDFPNPETPAVRLV